MSPIKDGQKRSPAEWAELEGITIRDPDGWRGPNGRDMDDAIHHSEWEWRRNMSTISGHLDDPTWARSSSD